jgi:hypothetical protein
MKGRAIVNEINPLYIDHGESAIDGRFARFYHINGILAEAIALRK